MTSVIDLTERKKAEEVLREREDRYRAVVEQAAEGIVLFDVDSKRELEANVACQTLLGYIPEAILRLTLHDLGRTPGSFPRIWLTYAEFERVADGACTATFRATSE
jgi:PAS domain-containing protein